MIKNTIWIFVGNDSTFPSGVFSSRGNAESWITENKLSGTLTLYPIDCGVYQWAIESNVFEASEPHQKTNDFISNFSSANFEHYHCSNGKIY